MTMKKSFIFTFFLSFLFLNMLSSISYSSVSKNLYDFLNLSMFSINFNFFVDLETLVYLFMVFLVTSMVLIYSEFYMDFYNNKKFFFLTLSFLLSMFLLTVSGSYVILMLGWDMLGLSSLFLIMFYPGKIPLFNSFVTFFYNRLGDCIMMMSICFMINSSFLFLNFMEGQDLYILLFLLLICSFAKSAQFPLSSWLPAAMSAPTPISAMVHSSTLVTAGIFIILKLFFYFELFGLMNLTLFISCLTFISGGILGYLEVDLKKIVAFSTMSQISLIILFCSLGMFFLSFSHMIFHAFFKTLLFCSCGLFFSWAFSDQLTKIFSSVKESYFFVFLIFLSIFCMSGMPFSSSFFSKDSFLEYCVSSSTSIVFLSVLIGSILTIMYSSKILSLFSSSSYSSLPSYVKKKSFFLFYLFFSSVTLGSPYITQLFLNPPFFPTVSSQDLLMVLFSLTMSIFLFPLTHSSLCFNSLELFFSKFYTFSGLSKFHGLDKYSFFFNDHLIFKPFTFFNTKNIFKVSYSFLILMFLFTVLFFLFVL